MISQMMTYLPHILIGIVGILIGHLLFYRYEDESENESQQATNDEKVREARSRLEAQFKQVAEQRKAYAQEHAVPKQELDKLRAANATLEKQWHELRSEHDQLKATLVHAQSLTEQNDELHDSQEQRIQELESALQTAIGQLQVHQEQAADIIQKTQDDDAERLTLQQEIASLTNQLGEAHEALETAQDHMRRVESKSNQQESEAVEWMDEKANLLQQLTTERDQKKSAEAKLISSESELAELRFEVESLRNDASEYDAPAKLISNLQNRVSQLTSERDDAAHLAKRSEDSLLKLQEKLKELETAKQQMRELKEQSVEQIDTLVAKTSDTEQLRSTCERQLNEIAQLKSYRDAALKKAEAAATQLRQTEQRKRQLESTLDSLRSENTTLKNDMNHLHSQLHEATENLHSISGEAEKERQKVTENEFALQALNEEISHLRQQLQSAHEIGANNAELQQDLVAKSEQHLAIKKQLESAIESELATKEIISDLRDELGERLKSLEALQTDKDNAIAQLAREKQSRTKLEQQWKRRLQATEREIRDLNDEVEKANRSLKRMRNERDRLKEQAKADRQFISLSTYQAPETHVQSFDEPEKLRLDAELGAIYKRRPKEWDDLKRISGIAAIMERKLNKLGVYRFRQIMRWDDLIVAELSALLGIGDRIQRENWIGQARRLHREQIQSEAA